MRLTMWNPICGQQLFPVSLFTITLYLLILVTKFFQRCTGESIQIVPHFTSIPPPVSYFISNAPDIPSLHHVDLICRVWPPNSKVYLFGSHLQAPTPSTNNEPTGAPHWSSGHITSPPPPPPPNTIGALLPIPHGLATQRYGLLSASKLQSSSSPASEQSQLTTDLRESIAYESLASAIREHPAAAAGDEVAVMLTVSSLPEARQLELMRLHCLAATAFGRVLSAPFHLTPTNIGDFPSSITSPGSSDGSTTKLYTVEFWINNIAVVDCQLPLNSSPAPLVHFELNGTVIGETALQTDKFRIVERPDKQRLSLLIHKVQPLDVGTYRCAVTNPLTGEKKYSPEVTQLKLIIPSSPVQTRIVVPLASSATADVTGSSGSTRSHKIVVDEGQNITLFCIIQGAPPPTVATYPFDQNTTAHNRFLRDRKFGLLQIINVQPKDAGFYICSDRHISSTAQLLVKPRLRLVTKPEDVRIARLGDRVQFRCATSDPQVTPFWLFNGQPRTSNGDGRDSTLILSNVTAMDLGIYQCVAFRKSDKQALLDEWISASAILALESDKVIRTSDELTMYIPQKPEIAPNPPTPEVTTAELTPQAQVLYDNLAVYLAWQPLNSELSTIGQSKAVEYRVEYSVQIDPVEEAQRHGGSNVSSHVPALIGLVGHEAVKWSEQIPLKQQTTMSFLYVTDTVLKPSKRYRFRVLAVDPSTGVGLVPPSDWSNVVSTEHISSVDPPEIKMVRPLSQGRVHLMWTFDGKGTTSGNRMTHPESVSADPTLGYLALSGAASSSSTFSLEPSSDLFIPEYFLVLARPLIKPKGNSADTFKYGTYWTTQVNGSNAREGMLTGLNRSASYQVIVYGVRGLGDKRRITRFSKAAYVNLATADHTGDGYSLLRALTTNRIMYLLVGGIAALMFFIIFIFILLCLCRQQRDRRLSSQRKKQNGYVQNYKDSNQYVPVSTTDGGVAAACSTGHSNAGTMSNRGPATGMLMMMSNLQSSAFSDHSAQHGQLPNSMSPQQQQQALYLQQQQQQQQADHYAAATAAAASKEMMYMQQHQSVLGSQLHLQQQLSNMSSPQQQQQQHPMTYHPQHHQSHHSLLLPSSAMTGNGGPQITPGNMFQSGTLPGGPRYLKQQGYPAHQFGSQQPLNQTASPVNSLDVNEFYHHHPPQMQSGVYAHQQPQLPPVPHPQTAELPPPHAGVNSGAMHQQMIYYPGSVTSDGVSMKREPPTGGSLQDTAYGTMLQRTQLTGSVMNTDAQAPSIASGGAMSPASQAAAAAAYYHDSQQALHMMQQQYSGRMGTPQVNHALMYSPRQSQQQTASFYQHPSQAVQQQQYPGYYGQQLPPPHPDSMGHTLHGFGPTDGESIYSYFSQQEMSLSNPHQPLNPLPEENQFRSNGASGYVDSSMQTAEINGQGGSGGNGGSPAAPGSHRHHRRRRRKQQQRHPTDLVNGNAEGTTTNDSAEAIVEGQSFVEQSENSHLDEQRALFENDLTSQKRHHSFSGSAMYSDTDPVAGQPNFSTSSYGQPNSAADPGRLTYGRFTGQLPPPNQPPPPPPPPGIAFSLGSPTGLTNGLQMDHHLPPVSLVYPSQLGMHPSMQSDSMSRRFYSGAPDGSGYLSGGTGMGLLVGPPPRIRDYSEYGIPRGIGLPPTPSGVQPQLSHHNSLMGSGNSAAQTHHLNCGNSTMYDGRYREGQA
ncbi:unnamed protein product [Dicrocoelium dendriticum]|nr:unnamed protein product [Dicrocoelium dendriticum]